jgi:integrase
MNAKQLERPTDQEAAAPNIIPLLPSKAPEKPADVSRHRFKILQFQNRGGSGAWRVTGSRRDGSRVRENFSDQRAAETRRSQLEAEFFSRTHEDSALRATRLTDTQLRIAESCFIWLDDDEEMLWALNHWLEHGRKQSVAESPGLDEAVEAFKQWLDTTPTLRERTKANLRLRVNVFANSIGNFRVADITPDTIEDFLEKRSVSPASRDNDRRAVSRFFRWCIERPRRWASLNPCREVRVEKNGDSAAPSILTLAECKKLLQAAEQYRKARLAPYVAVCLFGGLRPFEAARLTWEQINLEDREIRLESNQTKTKRARVITIDDTLAVWLAAHRGKPFYPVNWRKDFDAIKATAGFGNPDRLNKKQREKTAGLKPWPDDVMRHTAISQYFRRTGSYGQTAEQFGNSEAIIKKHYQGRVSSEDTKAFYALLPKKGGRK